MDLHLTDKVVIVTGGAKGIGAAAVELFAREGAIPVIVGRSPETGTTLLEKIGAAGDRGLMIASELSEVEARLSAEPRYYIPEDRIAEVEDGIQNGDIIAATSTVTGLDIAHTGIALWSNGRLHLLHAPLAGGVVQISQAPLAERIQRIGGQDGVMVARPLEAR